MPMEPLVAVGAVGGDRAAGLSGCCCGDVPPGRRSAASQEATACQSTLLSFSSQYLAFFEFNNRLEAILSKAYIYR